MVFIYAPWETYVLFKSLFKKSCLEYVRNILFYTIITIIAIVLTNFVCAFVGVDGIFGLIIKMVICVICPNILYLAAFFRTSEFAATKEKALRLIKK